MHCNTQTHTATRCNQMQCRALQHTDTHCNTLQHTATHCNVQNGEILRHGADAIKCHAAHCNTLTHCNTLQHTAHTQSGNNTAHCDTLTHCNTLNTLRTHKVETILQSADGLLSLVLRPPASPPHLTWRLLQVRCSVLQCVAVCRSM